MDETTATVLRVLEGQSPDYLIQPWATAFMVEGLTEEEVKVCLEKLADAGHARRDEIVLQQKQEDPETEEVSYVDQIDDDGNPVLLNEGWTITDEGKEEHARAAANR